ncbi:MAG: T9SS type A sorting domain-containing protein, partial [Flavobacteriales bacterium]|nr:T9SS type A sorting domain-containing protein [Flavobacteriales bacterium]
NNTDITCIHAEMRFTRSETSVFETHLDESNYYLDGSSSLFVSAPVTLSHGELDVSTTSKLYIHYGNLTIGENALLDWHSNTCEIIGGNSSLAFDHGQIHIPANHEFTFEYGGQQSGFIDIKPGSTNVIINDNNSIFRIHGFGKADLCLRITDATLKNINPQLGKFILSNCLIEMAGSAYLVTDMFFDASGSKFLNGKMALWHSPANIYTCDFEHSYIESKFQKIMIKHSNFVHGVFHADACSYYVEQTSFDASNIHSENLSSVSFLKQCDFTNDEYFFVADESLVELRVLECEFTSDGHFHSDHSPYGIFKVGGILTLKCNKFKDLNEAIHGANGCIISMTENDNSGNNQFTHCNHMIVCDDALDLKINDGYNDFSDVVTSVFTGNLDGYTCDNNGPDGECTHPELEANNNIWLHSSPPEEPDSDFHGTVTSNCDGPAEWEDCIIRIIDHSPIEEFICRDKTPIGKIEKSTTYTNGTGNSETFKYVPEVNPNQSNMNKDFEVGNPNITTSSFENTPLEEALLFAANTSELIDSLGNDSLCIDLFHQIIMSDIDLQDEEIRWKLLWGQRHMKSAAENRFTQGEITRQENEITFHSDVQKYVDVLNTLTYQLVPDSEYTQQYYLELDKGQLFNTLGDYQMANQIFTNLDDCEIDSLEQQILNGWIIQTQMAMDETSQYLAGVSLDSIQGTADTSSLLTPFVLLADTFFFGAIIHSPQFVEFAPCDLNNRNLRLSKNEDQTIKVYPNPSQGSFTVQNLGKQLIHSIELMDRSGRCIFKSGTITSDQQTLQINLTPTIASGLYILRINIGETSTHKTIAIQ